MTDPKLRRKLAEKAKEPKPRRQGAEGLAAAAGKNREARLRITEAFGRLGFSYSQWPDFVRALYTDPHQRIEYHQFMMPSPFQAPDFDRLDESPQDWVNLADRAWELHGMDSCKSARIGSAQVWTRKS